MLLIRSKPSRVMSLSRRWRSPLTVLTRTVTRQRQRLSPHPLLQPPQQMFQRQVLSRQVLQPSMTIPWSGHDRPTPV